MTIPDLFESMSNLRDRIESLELKAGETDETLKAHARRLKKLERRDEMYPGKVIYTNGPMWGKSILEQYNDALGRAEMMLAETKLRESLINLGWTPPPKEKCKHAGYLGPYRARGDKHCRDCGEEL